MTGVSAGIRNINEETVRGSWRWFLALGIILIILGITALAVPIAVSITMTVFIGIILLIAGVAQVAQAIASHRWGGFFAHLLGAAVYVLFGAALLADPEKGVRALTLLLALFFVTTGLVKIILSVAAHGEKNWGWLLFSGIVSLILGALIWAQWPSDSDWVIGLLVGIDLILSGWGLTMLAIAAKMPPPAAPAT